jgi:hypothetical protein
MNKTALRATILALAGLVAAQWSPFQPQHVPQDMPRLVQNSAALQYPIVFVSRNKIRDAKEDPCAIPGFGPVYRTAAVGGKLMLRESSGTVRALATEDRLYDVADPCVSWDASRILFAGLAHPDSSWRIYEVGADGFGLRQLTKSDRLIDLSQFGAAAPLFVRYDDFDPCYLPDGRICFASTRFSSLASFDGIRTSNIFVAHPDGSGIRRVTTEKNSGEEPTIDPVSGRIVYARWWVNRDRPSNVTKHGLARDDQQALTKDIANIWHAISVRSDGEGIKLYAGFPRTREGTQTYKPALFKDGRLLSIFAGNTSLTPVIGGTGLRWFVSGAGPAHHILGVAPDDDGKIPRPPFVADGCPLDSASVLVSYTATGDDFGIFLCTLDGAIAGEVYDLRGTHELEPVLLKPSAVPPVLEEEFPYPTSDLPPTEDPKTYLRNDMFRFDCMNMFANGAVDEAMPDAPRIAVGARIRFFMNVQRQSPAAADPAIFLKDAPVFLSGGIHEHDLPADVPLFEQVVGSDGRVLEAPGDNFAHVTGMNFDRMGSGTKCVGCHAGHSMLTVPLNGSMAEWINVSPSAESSSENRSVTAEGVALHAGRLVDRQARTGGDTVVWVAEGHEGANARLRWNIPVEVREFVMYGIPENVSKGTDVQVHDSEILLYYKNMLVRKIPTTGMILPEGTRISVPPTDIDSAVFVIRDVTGKFLGQSCVGLAEIETIARISRLNYHLNNEG